jgi:hypothetical protein
VEPERAGLPVQPQAPGVQRREQQEVVDQERQAVRVLVDDLQEARQRGRIVLAPSSSVSVRS